MVKKKNRGQQGGNEGQAGRGRGAGAERRRGGPQNHPTNQGPHTQHSIREGPTRRGTGHKERGQGWRQQEQHVPPVTQPGQPNVDPWGPMPMQTVQETSAPSPGAQRPMPPPGLHVAPVRPHGMPASPPFAPQQSAWQQGPPPSPLWADSASSGFSQAKSLSGMPAGHHQVQAYPEVGHAQQSMQNLSVTSQRGAIPKQKPHQKPPRQEQSRGGGQQPSSSQLGKRAFEKDPLEWEKKNAPGSVSVHFADNAERRKKVGKRGKKIKLLANHFEMEIGSAVIYRYDVDITFTSPWKRPAQKRDKPFLYRAIEQLKSEGKLQKFAVFDGMRNVYSPKTLFPSDQCQVQVTVPEFPGDPQGGHDVEMTLKVQFTGKMDIAAVINAFRKSGALVGPDGITYTDAINALNIILGYGVNVDASKFMAVGRSYFSNKGRVENLGEGKYLWLGTFQRYILLAAASSQAVLLEQKNRIDANFSVRVGWKIHLNIDMANKPGYVQEPLMNFIRNFLHDTSGGKCRDVEEMVDTLKKNNYIKAVSCEIKDLKSKFLRPDGQKRDQRINGLKRGALQEVVINDETKEKCTVFDYFVKTYNYSIKYPDLPLVWVGNRTRNILLPIELLELKQQCCPKSKALSAKNTQQMIKVTAVRPDKRQENIRKNLQARSFKKDKYANAFNITVHDNLAQIDGRILEPPKLDYNRIEDPKMATPANGKWKMPTGSTFRQPMSLESWGVFVATKADWNLVQNLQKAIVDECRKMGMAANPPLVRALQSGELEDEFKAFFNDIKRKCNGAKPQIIMAIVHKDERTYPILKRLGDTELEMPTQCVRLGTLQKANAQVIHNIVIKINSKLGGTNQVINPTSRKQEELYYIGRPIIVMGADVTHPAPGEIGRKPSIAAVVGSTDPAISKFRVEVRVQASKDSSKEGTNVIEQILDMELCTYNLLKKFHDINNGRKPERIIFYRDGVSEGQFQIVLNKELSAIQRACKRLNPEYHPGITFFVAQKRHKTRLFPKDKKDGVGRMGNVPPGTVVDVDITHPTVNSFFLASHEGIQGTTKPTYYVKLHDDNDMTADQEQALTFFLCHTYARCERSVSYPAPTYYSHLAAERARCHHNALLDKYGDHIPHAELARIQNLVLVNYFV